MRRSLKTAVAGCGAALVFAALCVLAVCAYTGGGATPYKAVAISGMPVDAELVYTYTSPGAVAGAGVTGDAWSHTGDTGFFVLEFVPDGGSIRQMELRKAGGDRVASFGNIAGDALFITDLVIEATGDYAFYFGKADDFSGEIRVYFVAGIGYSMEG